MLVLEIALVALLSVVSCSIVEGLFHRYILHTRLKGPIGDLLEVSYVSHAIEHHPAYRGEDYHRPAPEEEKPISLGPVMWPALMILVSPVTVGLWMWRGPAVALTVPIAYTLYYIMYEFLHWHMHFPRKDGKPRWYHAFPPSRQLFEWFDKRHYVHHDADDRNFNVVFPVYDLMVGTYTTDPNVIPRAILKRKAKALAKSAAIRAEVEAKKSTTAVVETQAADEPAAPAVNG
jgi:hypothetical protein